MFKFSSRKLSQFALPAILGVASATLSACGSGQGSPNWGGFNPPLNGGCPAGTYNFGYGCVSNGTSFADSCYFNGGVMQQDSTGRNLCVTQKTFSLQGSTVPKLTSGSASTGAWTLAQELRVHDLVKIEGSVEYGSLGWEIFALNCKNGKSSPSADVPMAISVGTSTASLQAGQMHAVTSNGQLKLGVNDSGSYSCFVNNNLRVVVKRCQDSTGMNYPCP